MIHNNNNDPTSDGFLEAIKLGDNSKVRKLISHELYVNQVVNDLTPLSFALTLGRIEIAELLITSGADVCQLDGTGKYSPMFYAIKNKSPVSIIKRLISAGAPKDGIVEYNFRSTALHLAVFANQKSIVKCLLNLSADVNSRDVNGLTPLHIAVQGNHPKTIKLLLKSGATIDAECHDKFTPLMYAIHDNNTDLVKLLLSLGSNVNHEPKEPKYSYQRPLNYAAGLGHVKIVLMLLSQGADAKSPTTFGDSALHSVAYSEKLHDVSLVQEISRLLINYGLELNCLNNLKFNPLHSAVLMKNTTVVRAFLEMGANVFSLAKFGNTSLHTAAKVGDALSVKLLLAYGANMAIVNKNGLTPYDLALTQKDVNVVKVFWKNGWPYDAGKLKTTGDNKEIDKDMQTLLCHQENFLRSVEIGDREGMLRALCNGAEAKGCKLSLKYPLHFAVSQNFEDIVNDLLEKGVEVCSLDGNGETPLHVAAKAGNLTICILLLSRGACYNYSSSNCPNTPFQLACSHKRKEVQEIFEFINMIFHMVKKQEHQNIVPAMQNKQRSMECSAFLNCTDKRGHTLLTRAIAKGFNETAKSLMQFRLEHFKH